MNWYDAASYCEKTYGIEVNYEEEYFICPECGEPIYEFDWQGAVKNFNKCPICDFDFIDEEF